MTKSQAETKLSADKELNDALVLAKRRLTEHDAAERLNRQWVGYKGSDQDDITIARALVSLAARPTGTDWHVVSEAVDDAVANGDGRATAGGLERAFKHHGLVVSHGEPNV